MSHGNMGRGHPDKHTFSGPEWEAGVLIEL